MDLVKEREFKSKEGIRVRGICLKDHFIKALFGTRKVLRKKNNEEK